MRYPKPDDFEPETHFPDDWPVVKRRETPRCRSWNPNEGRQCANSPMKTGNGIPGIRCDSHGGKSLGGIASPNLKSGLYSKFLPVALEGEHQALLALGDDLFRIDQETTLIVGLIQEQLSRIDEGESGQAWAQLREIFDELSEVGAITNKSAADVARFNSLFSRLGRVINYGAAQWMARAEVVKLVEQKRKLVDSERKDRAAKFQSMSYDRVMLVLTAIVSSFRTALDRYVDDEDSRKQVLNHAQGALKKITS